MAKTTALAAYRAGARAASRPRARHRAKTRIPLAVVLGFAPLVTRFMANVGPNGQGLEYASKRALEDMTGYRVEDGKFMPFSMEHTARFGLWPVAAGFVAHWAAGKLGVNRMIARSGIPFISI